MKEVVIHIQILVIFVWKKKVIIIPVSTPAIMSITRIFLILKLQFSPGSAKQNKNPKAKATTFDNALILEQDTTSSPYRKHKNTNNTIILIFQLIQYLHYLLQCCRKYPKENPIMPVIGVVDYIVAFLLEILLARMPITPVTIASTKQRLKPIALCQGADCQDSYASQQVMVEVSEQDHTGKYTVIMIAIYDMIGIILSQLEQSSLSYLQKFVIIINFYIICRSVVRLRVYEYKTDKEYPEKAEGVSCKIGEKCKACHFQKRLLIRFYLTMEETCTKRRNSLIYPCFKLSHMHSRDGI